MRSAEQLIANRLEAAQQKLLEQDTLITQLQLKLADIEGDPFKDLYRALNSQVRKITKQLEEVDIQIDGDDKVFDRFIKLNESLRKILENLEFVGVKTGAKQEQEEKKRINPIEQRATNAAQVRQGSR